MKSYGIDVEKFACWEKMEELRLVAKCVKHGDGDSCEKLKTLRADLFVSPFSKEEYKKYSLGVSTPVLRPLAGKDLFIEIGEFSRYAEAVKQFWDELARPFDFFEHG